MLWKPLETMCWNSISWMVTRHLPELRLYSSWERRGNAPKTAGKQNFLQTASAPGCRRSCQQSQCWLLPGLQPAGLLWRLWACQPQSCERFLRVNLPPQIPLVLSAELLTKVVGTCGLLRALRPSSSQNSTWHVPSPQNIVCQEGSSLA